MRGKGAAILGVQDYFSRAGGGASVELEPVGLAGLARLARGRGGLPSCTVHCALAVFLVRSMHAGLLSTGEVRSVESAAVTAVEQASMYRSSR